MDWNDNKLTAQIRGRLKQGTKIKFCWHGSKMEYNGRIEIKNNVLYFVNEHHYEGEDIAPDNENYRYYNPLDSFGFFTMFEIIE